MRAALRSFLFSIASVYLAHYIIAGFDFGENTQKTFYLICVAVALLNLFILPILDLISLPTKGLPFIFLSTILILITLYGLSVFVDDFSIVESTLPELRILGFVLPSKDLTVFWSAVFSSFVVSGGILFLRWVCRYKK